MNASRLVLAIAFVALTILAFAPHAARPDDTCCRPKLVDGHLLCADCKRPDKAWCGVRGKKGCNDIGCDCDGGCIKPKGSKTCGKGKKTRSDAEDPIMSSLA